MKQLRFKNSLYQTLFVAAGFSFYDVLICTIVSMICLWGGGKGLNIALYVFGGVLLAIWLIAGLAILLNKTVIVVTADEIKKYKGCDLKWCIKKEDIIEGIHNKMP